MKHKRRLLAVLTLAGVHALISWRLLALWGTSPALLVEMSSTIASKAQVYFDTGAGIKEAQSSVTAVQAGATFRELRLSLPNRRITALRFDPLTAPGIIFIRRAAVLRSDGSTAFVFPLSHIRQLSGFDEVELLPSGVRCRVKPDSSDPQLRLDLDSPLELTSRYPGRPVILRILFCNLLLLLFEVVCVLLPARKVVFLVPLHGLISWALLSLWSVPPVLLVVMSSSVISRAQVYFDAGAGMSEEQSESAPVYGGSTFEHLQFPLPRRVIKALRFDPLNCPGSVVIQRVSLLRSDGSTPILFDSAQFRAIQGFDETGLTPAGMHYRVASKSYDPQIMLDLKSPIDLESHYPGDAVLLRLFLFNAILVSFEALVLFWPSARVRTAAAVQAMDDACARLAAYLSSDRFIVFDRVAIRFYAACAALFIIVTLADLNGSSMGVFWANYKVGYPPNVIVGNPQQARADEFNYQTPGMLNQCFRERRFEVAQTASGGHSIGLLAELPVRHISTWFRPQFWPFFLFRSDYGFAAWWQAKALIFLTGVFTFLLLITQSSSLALTGTLWLFFSQFTQWCYSWPSMLPEMAGLFCFTLVFACYLSVGTQKMALALSAVACAACATNFALSAYVPHMIPYAWAGVAVGAAWCAAYRARILRAQGRGRRIVAALGCAALTGCMLLIVFHDAREAVRGVAATTYPGHRAMNGGGMTLSTLGTHFLAPFENERRFPPAYSNISEASGFLWLAPVTLFCIGRMRALPAERRTLLAGMWVAAFVLLCWMFLPVPAEIGRILFFDRVQGSVCCPRSGCSMLLSSCFFLAPRRRHATSVLRQSFC